MTKKIIQVPIDEEFLKDLDSLSQKKHKSRAELIRQACLIYLERSADEERDKIYQQGYMKIPEEPEVGEMQISISSEILPKESW